MLDGHPAKFAPAARFSYSNSGYVVLALLAERATGTPFHELVQQRVCAPAGMHDPAGGYTHTVLSNTTAGAWPVTRRLDELLTP